MIGNKANANQQLERELENPYFKDAHLPECGSCMICPRPLPCLRISSITRVVDDQPPGALRVQHHVHGLAPAIEPVDDLECGVRMTEFDRISMCMGQTFQHGQHKRGEDNTGDRKKTQEQKGKTEKRKRQRG